MWKVTGETSFLCSVMFCGILTGTTVVCKAEPAVFLSCFLVLLAIIDQKKRKGRKKGADSMSQAVLDLQSQALLETIQQPWILTHKWAGVREALKQLADSLSKYSAEKRLEVSENHNLSVPVRQASPDGVSEKLIVISSTRFVKPTLASRHCGLQEALYRAKNYTPLYLNDFLPADRR